MNTETSPSKGASASPEDPAVMVIGPDGAVRNKVPLNQISKMGWSDKSLTLEFLPEYGGERSVISTEEGAKIALGGRLRIMNIYSYESEKVEIQLVLGEDGKILLSVPGNTFTS